jgi:hypothetical protein
MRKNLSTGSHKPTQKAMRFDRLAARAMTGLGAISPNFSGRIVADICEFSKDALLWPRTSRIAANGRFVNILFQ